MDRMKGSSKSKGRLQKKELRRWEAEFFPGGRELMRSMGRDIVLGQSFAFLREGWHKHPTIASILQMAEEVKVGPRLFPLWGDEPCSLPGVRLYPKTIPKMTAGGLWTDRESYQADADPVRIVVYAPFQGEKRCQVEVFLEGEKVGQEIVRVDNHGVGYVELQGLPAGRYRLRLDQNESSEATFEVALPRLKMLGLEWMQHYIQDVSNNRQVIVFVVKADSFGAPLRGDVGINLIDKSVEPHQPISGDIFRPDGAGRIAGELAIAGAGPFAFEIQSLSDKALNGLFSVPGFEETPEVEVKTEHPVSMTLNLLGQVEAWRWRGDDLQGMGFEKVQQTEWRDAPVVLQSSNEGEAVFKVHSSLSACTALVLDPIEGFVQTFRWPELHAGQEFRVSVPAPLGVVMLGAFLNGEPWEGWTVIYPEKKTGLELLAPLQIAPGEVLPLQIQTGFSEEYPVYLKITERDTEEPSKAWGPSALLEQALKSTIGGTLEEAEFVELWKSVRTKTIHEPKVTGSVQRSLGAPSNLPAVGSFGSPPPGSPPPTCGIRPPSGSPPPGSPPPGSPPPNMMPQGGTPPPSKGPLPDGLATVEELQSQSQVNVTADAALGWKLPVPSREFFAKTVFCGLLPVAGQTEFSFPVSDEQNFYRIEALLLAGREWSYASADFEVGQPTFSEIIAPESTHIDDQIQGEVIITTDQEQLWLDLRCEEQPVALWSGGQELDSQSWSPGPVVQYSFSAKPGNYVLKVYNTSQELVDEVETQILPWGYQEVHGLSVQMITAGSFFDSSSSETEKGSWSLLDSLEPLLQIVADPFLRAPSGNCEQEAARVCVTACMLTLTGNDPAQGPLMETLEASLGALEEMLIPGMGLRLTPGGEPDHEKGKQAVFHLWEASIFLSHVEHPLAGPMNNRIQRVSYDAGRGYRLQQIPDRMQSPRDAYRVFQTESIEARKQEAAWEVERRLQEVRGQLAIWSQSGELEIQQSCYAATVLWLTDEREKQLRALSVMNPLMQMLQRESGFLSIQDNLAFLHFIRSVFPVYSDMKTGSALINGEVVNLSQMEHWTEFPSFQGHEGSFALIKDALRQIDLCHFQDRVRWQVGLLNKKTREPIREMEIGQRLELVVVLSEKYEAGDLLEVSLPPCLAWLGGASEQRQFTIPWERKKRMVLDLVALTTTENVEGRILSQHWGVRLSNAFSEKRGNAVFERSIVVMPTGKKRKKGAGLIGRWRKVFG